jgi:hypothetical protein
METWMPDLRSAGLRELLFPVSIPDIVVRTPDVSSSPKAKEPANLKCVVTGLMLSGHFFCPYQDVEEGLSHDA